MTLLFHVLDPALVGGCIEYAIALPQQTGARHYIEQADGVDPLQLEAYADFMEPATGVPRDGYSVTMPPFSTGSPRVDNTVYLPDPALLGLLGVRYVLADFELEVSQFSFVRRFGATRVYKNDLAKPLAWVQRETSSLGEAIQPVTIED